MFLETLLFDSRGLRGNTLDLSEGIQYFTARLGLISRPGFLASGLELIFAANLFLVLCAIRKNWKFLKPPNSGFFIFNNPSFGLSLSSYFFPVFLNLLKYY